jgi:hypothetical protein
MGGGILQSFGHIMSPGNDLTIDHNHGANGYLIIIESISGFPEGLHHIIVIGHDCCFE